jgi:hypothetical protein
MLFHCRAHQRHYLGQKSGGWKDVMCVGILLSFEPFSELELWVAEPWRNGYTSFCVIVILSFEFFVIWLLKDLPPGMGLGVSNIFVTWEVILVHRQVRV